MEYCNGGDLESFLEKRLILKEKEVRVIFTQVLHAMKEMNRIRAIHRDIKNANILLHFADINDSQSSINIRNELTEDNVSVKLADFGFSTILGQNEMTRT